MFVATKLFRVGELRTVLRFDRLEFALAGSTLVVVALVGIEQGVLVAMVLSLADRTRRSARPRDTVLGREPGTDHWIPVDIGRTTEQVPGSSSTWSTPRSGTATPTTFWLHDPPARRCCASARARGGPRCRRHVRHRLHRAFRPSGTSTAELDRARVALGIARASHLVHHDLKHGALLQQLGADHLFASVDEAVDALVPSS